MMPREDWDMWKDEGSSYFPVRKSRRNPFRTIARWIRRLRRR